MGKQHYRKLTVLRLWNSSVYARVFLGEEQITVCLIQGKFQPKVIDKAHFDSSSSELSDGFVLLKEWLIKNFNGQHIEWVLGVHYVRHLMLPWSNQHLKVGFSNHLARQLFSKQFQQDANAYEIKITKLDYAQPLLATFFDKSVVLALQQFAKDSEFKNIAIEPLMAVVWNRFYRQIKNSSMSLAIVDQGRALIIQQDKGKINNLSLRPFINENMLINNQKQHTFFFYPSRISDEATVQYLDLRDGKQGSVYSYPLCGVF